MTEYYCVREDLKRTLPGPYYQVLVSLLHIFEALEQGLKFKAKLEVAGVGALDDIVFEYFDNSGTETGKSFLQLKHASNNDETLSEGDFYNESGKCEIFKYFDDWFMFVGRSFNTKCVYYTNRDFDYTLKQSGYFQQEGNSYRFSENFFQQHSQFRQKLLQLITQHSVICNQSLVRDASRQKIAKNPTYQSAESYYQKGGASLTGIQQQQAIDEFLMNYYRLMVGKLHVDELEKEVFKKVETYIGNVNAESIFNALIHDTWRWFRKLGFAEVWTDETVKENLGMYQQKFSHAPQEIGRSSYELSQYLLKADPVIERKDLLARINQHIELSNGMVVFQGKEKAGKSTLISTYLLQQSSFRQGEYLYFNSLEIFLSEYTKLTQIDFIKLFIIDNIHQDYPELQSILADLWNKGKKLFLISSVSITRIDSFNIPVLSKEEIQDYLTKSGGSENAILIGKKILPLKDLIELGDGGVFNCMRYPEDLKSIDAISRPISDVNQTFDPNMESAYLANSSRHARSIPLDAEEVVPLYTLDALCTLAEFKGSKWVSYKTIDNFLNFKNSCRDSDKFSWVDLSLISFPNDPAISVNIELLLKNQLTDVNSERYQEGKITLLLFYRTEIEDSYPEHLISVLLKLSRIVVFSRNRMRNPISRQFFLITQNNECYFECHREELQQLPMGSSVTKNPIGPIQRALMHDQRCADGVVIIAEAGAGKSTSLKMLLGDYIQSASLIWGDYHHLVLVPLSKLVHLKSGSLFNVIKHFLGITHVILDRALSQDLLDNKVLFLLDGWDELDAYERQELNLLFSLFAQYKHIVITTRPTDRDNLFFSPLAVYELQRFTMEKISNFFHSFFQCTEHSIIAENFANEAIKFLGKPANKDALAVIGLPLQCYLLCQAWQPDFEATCRGEKIELPWIKTAVLSRVELYQLFVTSRLRKFLFDQYGMSRNSVLTSVDEICTLGYRYLLALQEGAYQQLFRGKPLKLGSDSFSNHIRRLDIIDDNEFTHKTYAEYFSALYLVNLLMKDVEKARKVIEHYRYQTHYRLVFEFAAGIVSYGDPIISEAKSCLTIFWESLLQAPRDCIGIVDNILISACYAQSDRSSLKIYLDSEAFLSLHSYIRESEDKQDVETSVPPSMPALSITANEEIVFNKPEQPFDYTTCRNNILQLPVEKYNYQEKEKAANWLIDKMENTGSFIIKEACADKFGALGIATTKLITRFIHFLQLEDGFKFSRVKENIVRALIALEIRIETLSDEFFQIIIRELLRLAISDEQLNWLISQDFTDEKVDIILHLLNETSYIADQKRVIIALTNSDNEKRRNFLEKLIVWLQGKNLGTIRYWIQYVLVNSQRMDVALYIDSILLLNYEADFIVLSQSLDLMSEFINSDFVNDSYKSAWVNKVYQFSLTAIQQHDHKNSISSFIIALVQLRIDQDRMRHLLSLFLSTTADYGYWDCDAVFPCLSHLAPYFNQYYADYLIYKTTMTGGVEIYQLIDKNFAEHLADDESKKMLILACLEIYKRKFKHKKSIENGNTISYIKMIKPDLVMDTIFKDLTVSIPESVCFVKEYIKINAYALIIYDDQVRIYTPGGMTTKAITLEIKKQLEKDNHMSLMLPNGLNLSIRKRPRSPDEFSFPIYFSGNGTNPCLFKSVDHDSEKILGIESKL